MMMDKIEKHKEIFEHMTDKTWAEKLEGWRVNSEKHWAWRSEVAKFLRKKVAEESK